MIMVVHSFYILFSCLLLSVCCAQNVNTFTGIYHLEETCVCTAPYEGVIRANQYKFEILESTVDSFDLQFHLRTNWMFFTRANITSDSTFRIPRQSYPSVPYWFIVSGVGKIRNDSLYLSLTEGSYAAFDCESSGPKEKITAIKLNKSLGVQELSLYPNPTQKEVTIYAPEPDAWNITLRTMHGELLLSYSFFGSEYHLQLPPLASGIYLMHVGNGTTEHVKKLVIQ